MGENRLMRDCRRLNTGLQGGIDLLQKRGTRETRGTSGHWCKGVRRNNEIDTLDGGNDSLMGCGQGSGTQAFLLGCGKKGH